MLYELTIVFGKQEAHVTEPSVRPEMGCQHQIVYKMKCNEGLRQARTFEALKHVFSGVRIKSYNLKIKMGRPWPSGQTAQSSKSTNETIGSNRNTTDSGWQFFS